jgi:hypothetical protein
MQVVRIWITGGTYGPEAGAVGIAFRFVIIALLLLWVASGAGEQGDGCGRDEGLRNATGTD